MKLTLLFLCAIVAVAMCAEGDFCSPGTPCMCDAHQKPSCDNHVCHCHHDDHHHHHGPEKRQHHHGDNGCSQDSDCTCDKGTPNCLHHNEHDHGHCECVH